MKKALLVTTIILAYTLSTAAQQTRPRSVLDNFSSGKSPVISTPKAFQITSKTPPKQLVKKTVKGTPVRPTPVVWVGTAPLKAAKDINEVKDKFASRGSLKGFSTGDTEVDGYILESCARYSIDPILIYSQMSQESSFKRRALSNKGASGLMQLMPATARRFGVTNIYDPRQNIEGGVKYMRWLLDTFNGDLSLALAGYNAGEGAVMKYGWAIPPYNETQDYVRRITARYETLRDPKAVRNAVKNSPINTPLEVKLEVKKAGSIDLGERAVYVIKTPDGKMQLVNL